MSIADNQNEKKFSTVFPFSSPETTILLACSRSRELWEQPFQACAIDVDCVKPDRAEFGYFLFYFKMVVPRALLFLPQGRRLVGSRDENALYSN